MANERQLNAVREGYSVTMQSVDRPAEVRFDHGEKRKRDRFVFAVTAAGWHTGALVIDLEPEVCGMLLRSIRPRHNIDNVRF